MRRLIALALAVPALPQPALAATPQDEIAAQAPPPPDYADAANWAAGPGGPGAAAALPEGASPAARAPQVEVFYVHPTTLRSQTAWNQDVRDAEANAWVDASVIARQASAFSACCRIWAPRYRAASYKALMDAGHRDAAFALAYADVERAFDRFLSRIGGHPFIIAGHSQGAKHIGDLLEKRIDGTALQQRLVAAYIVGINIAQGEFGPRFRHVPVCARPDQTGCALQWNALEAGADVGKVAAAYEKTFTDHYGEAPGRETLCINPVTFDARRSESLSAEAKGAVPGDPGFGAVRALRKGAVAVRCERGMAVSYLAPGLDMKPLPGGSLHYHDFGLFYADIRANAALRSRAWVRAHR